MKLIKVDRGFWTVEANGKRLEVFLARIESGWKYEQNGRWLPESDPQVIEEKERSCLRWSRACSCVNGASVNPPLSV